MRLSAILSSEDILVDVEPRGIASLFRDAGNLFERRRGVSAEAVAEGLAARERLGSTGLGQGVAIPHGRIEGLKETLVAVFRMRRPLPFDAPDGAPVSLFVFLLVPEAATEAHLELLAETAEMLGDRGFRERLAGCNDPASMQSAVETWRTSSEVSSLAVSAP